ncbi:MAG: hypothetical protein WAV23_03665 [Minisyncoccia bacterium]
MKKSFFSAFMAIALLFGLSTVCNAQKAKEPEKKTTFKEKVQNFTKNDATAKKSTNTKTAAKKPVASNTTTTAEVKKTESSAPVVPIVAEKKEDPKIAELQKQLSEKNAENLRLQAIANANKVEADSMAKQLYASKYGSKTEEKETQTQAPSPTHIEPTAAAPEKKSHKCKRK